MTDSKKTKLRSYGVQHPERVLGWLEKGDLVFPESFWPILDKCANPDAAVLALLRLFEANPQVSEVFEESLPIWQGFLTVAGLSDALSDLIIAHPQLLQAFSRPLLHQDLDAGEMRQIIHSQMQESATDIDALRSCYYRLLIEIARIDLLADDSVSLFALISRALSDLADAALCSSLSLAKAEIANPIPGLRFSVVALGKCGARELNYISDVDVMFVADWPNQVAESEALNYATKLANRLSAIVSIPGDWRPLWPLDAGLRPEGNDGALVRGLDSYRRYYQEWAQSWEFQALLKARPAAGDLSLGKQFVEMVEPFIWSASARPEFVEQARAMRQRVESNIRHSERSRHLKLGVGGLRDVEFTVQLLQLVHGRVDTNLRASNTLAALQALTEGGYVNRVEAAELGQAYRYLRTIEHHIQLRKLKRSHLIPSESAQLLCLARSLRKSVTSPEKAICTLEAATAETLEANWNACRSRVRRLHEHLFYRPLLPATAVLRDEDIELTPAAAKDRLQVIGYLDPQSALIQIKQLTSGVSRRARIVRQVLPAMLGWLADGANPDRGLLEFRIIAEEVGDSQWFARTLRDSRQAAKRLCKILPTSVLLSEAIKLQPTMIRWFDGDTELSAPLVETLIAEQKAVISRQESFTQAADRVRALRGRELARTALADMIYGVDIERTSKRLAESTQVAIVGALEIAVAEVPVAKDLPICVIAMGRLGGGECGYGSDADLVLIHDDQGWDPAEATKVASAVAVKLRAILSASPHSLGVDFDLRPEGKQGPLSRSLVALRRYYQHWSVAWERQALVRARIVAGDPKLGSDYLELINQLRWGNPLSSTELIQVRLLKARMEKERLPRGHKPSRNVKLGPGGLSDVEWTVQLIQMQHAHRFPQLQVTSTLRALTAAEELGLIASADAGTLRTAWLFASRIRAANGLALGHTRGLKIDILPSSDVQRIAVAKILGYAPGEERKLDEEYLRAARHARSVFEQIFQGNSELSEEYA